MNCAITFDVPNIKCTSLVLPATHTYTRTRTHTQMESRMKRMERRLAIFQKRSASKSDSIDTDPSPQQSQLLTTHISTSGHGLTPKLHPHSELTNTDKQSRSRSSSNDCTPRMNTRVHSQPATPVTLDVPPPEQPQSSNISKRSTKRKSQAEAVETESTPKKRKVKQSEVRTRLRYVGLDLPVPRPKKFGAAQTIHPQASDNNEVLNHLDVVGNSADLTGSNSRASSSCNVSVQGSEVGTSMLNGSEEVIVPSWRIASVPTTTENLDSDDNDVSGLASDVVHALFLHHSDIS